MQVARELIVSVQDLMYNTRGVLAEQCRIVVRGYANVLGLSKALAQADFVNNEPRSLSTFTSAFTRAQDLFDFVDAAGKRKRVVTK